MKGIDINILEISSGFLYVKLFYPFLIATLDNIWQLGQMLFLLVALHFEIYWIMMI